MKLFNKDDIVQFVYEDRFLKGIIHSRAGSRYLVRLIKYPTITLSLSEEDMVLFQHGDINELRRFS